MMEYETFKQVVNETFKDYLPEQYKNMIIKINTVEKINRTVDGINLIPDNNEISLSPVIYINDMYEYYQKCNDLEETLQLAVNKMVNAMTGTIKTPKLDFNKAKDNIVFQFINTEQNKEMLKNVPYRNFLDLSIIYRWIVEIDDKGIQSTIIKNDLMNNLGLNENQLFELAEKNTYKLLPPTIKTMKDELYRLLIKDGLSAEWAEIMTKTMSDELSMYIISNDKGINGAISVLYTDTLHELAERLNNDLFILPSSIHETIAISASIGNPNTLVQMVTEINMSEVSLSERLSNQVYYYNRNTRKITLATNTSNEKLNS